MWRPIDILFVTIGSIIALVSVIMAIIDYVRGSSPLLPQKVAQKNLLLPIVPSQIFTITQDSVEGGRTTFAKFSDSSLPFSVPAIVSTSSESGENNPSRITQVQPAFATPEHAAH